MRHISKLAALALVLTTPALAQEGAGETPAEVAATMDKGDVAWMLVSTVLVFLMIAPGIGLFYGGLVRAKNMLSILMQVFVEACVIMIAS